MTRIDHIGSNQTVVEKDNGTQILVSYSTPVAAWIPGEGFSKTEVKYSKTTNGHINKWCGKSTKTKPQSFFDSLV